MASSDQLSFMDITVFLQLHLLCRIKDNSLMKLHCEQFERSFDATRNTGYGKVLKSFLSFKLEVQQFTQSTVYSFKYDREIQEVAWSKSSRKRKLNYCEDQDGHREKLYKKLFQSKNTNDMLKNMTKTSYNKILRDEYRGKLELSASVDKYQKELRNLNLSTVDTRMQR